MTDQNEHWKVGEGSMVYVNPAPHAAACPVPSGMYGTAMIGYTQPKFEASGIEKSLDAVRQAHEKVVGELTSDRDRYKRLYEEVRDKLARVRQESEHNPA